MEFRKITVNDCELVRSFTSNGESSCENAFVNLLVWQNAYGNEMCMESGMLFVRSGSERHWGYRLPMGGDLKKGMDILSEFEGKPPVLWIPEGERYEEFMTLYSDKYELRESRDAFDYVYEREALATLSGKKYHGKRNHISAFGKKHAWHYEPITSGLIDSVRECAECWYTEKSDRLDRYMRAEREGIDTMLGNMDALKIKGGAIVVEGRVVAFTLGSAINDHTFDIHVEKALSDYAEGYTVINREFVRHELSDFQYINREDDMGLEGLRRAKLSYKPVKLIKKYSGIPKERL